MSNERKAGRTNKNNCSQNGSSSADSIDSIDQQEQIILKGSSKLVSPNSKWQSKGKDDDQLIFGQQNNNDLDEDDPFDSGSKNQIIGGPMAQLQADDSVVEELGMIETEAAVGMMSEVSGEVVDDDEIDEGAKPQDTVCPKNMQKKQ